MFSDLGASWASDRVVDEVIDAARGGNGGGSASSAGPVRTVIVQQAPAPTKIFGLSPIVLLAAGVGLYFFLRRKGE